MLRVGFYFYNRYSRQDWTVRQTFEIEEWIRWNGGKMNFQLCNNLSPRRFLRRISPTIHSTALTKKSTMRNVVKMKRYINLLEKATEDGCLHFLPHLTTK